MATVLLVRHGLTAMTGPVLAGHTPGVHLDERGRAQAAAVAARLATGAAGRGRQQPAGALRGRPPRRRWPAVTLSRGPTTGWPRSATATGPAGRSRSWPRSRCGRSCRRTRRRRCSPGPEGEALARRRPGRSPRCATGTPDHRSAGPDAVWLACSHGDVIKAVLADALGMHLDQFQRIVVDPCSVSVVTLHRDPAVRAAGQRHRRRRGGAGPAAEAAPAPDGRRRTPSSVDGRAGLSGDASGLVAPGRPRKLSRVPRQVHLFDRPSASSPGRSASPATARSSCRRRGAAARSASRWRSRRSQCSPSGSRSCSTRSQRRLRRAGARRDADVDDIEPLDTPVDEEFRVGTMGLAWDGDAEPVVVEARAAGDEPIDEDDEPRRQRGGPRRAAGADHPGGGARVRRPRPPGGRPPAGRRARCAGCRWTRPGTSARGRTATAADRATRVVVSEQPGEPVTTCAPRVDDAECGRRTARCATGEIDASRAWTAATTSERDAVRQRITLTELTHGVGGASTSRSRGSGRCGTSRTARWPSARSRLRGLARRRAGTSCRRRCCATGRSAPGMVQLWMDGDETVDLAARAPRRPAAAAPDGGVRRGRQQRRPQGRAPPADGRRARVRGGPRGLLPPAGQAAHGAVVAGPATRSRTTRSTRCSEFRARLEGELDGTLSALLTRREVARGAPRGSTSC